MKGTLMFYYFVRIVIVLILYIIFIAIFRRINRKKIIVKKLSKKASSISNKLAYILSFILITAVASYPYEGYFLRFNSVEQSVNYSVPNSFMQPVSYIKDGNTIFLVTDKKDNNSEHSITLYDNGYSMCDFNTQSSMTTIRHINIDDTYISFTINSIYNKTTDRTCYFLGCLSLSKSVYRSDFKIFDESNRQLKEFQNLNYNSMRMFYKIINGKPENSFSIIINNQVFDLL